MIASLLLADVFLSPGLQTKATTIYRYLYIYGGNNKRHSGSDHTWGNLELGVAWDRQRDNGALFVRRSHMWAVYFGYRIIKLCITDSPQPELKSGKGARQLIVRSFDVNTFTQNKQIRVSFFQSLWCRSFEPGICCKCGEAAIINHSDLDLYKYLINRRGECRESIWQIVGASQEGEINGVVWESENWFPG